MSSQKLGAGLIGGVAVVTVFLAAFGDDGGPIWDYDGKNGPEFWGTLSDDYATCDTGHFQSPFDLHADVTADLPSLEFAYGEVPVAVTHTGNTLEVHVPEGNMMTVDGVAYELSKLQFHTPSEFTIDGHSFPMAMDLVHTAEDGTYGIVGVMLEIDEDHPTIERLWEVAPTSRSTISSDEVFEISTLLPANGDYMRFMGSLTAPPCTEAVNWHMMTTPITVSAEQVAAFEAIFPMNARPLQDENHRLVVSDSK